LDKSGNAKPPTSTVSLFARGSREYLNDVVVTGKEGVSVVAVKTLKENANEKEKSDLLSELQVMKMLETHPNVVRLLGCCTDKEPIFLIMEYISRGKLQSYLRNSRAERYYNNMHGQSKSLTSRDLTSFVYQVAKGMEFLSANGVRMH
jgi:fibroblast growth factor receptor 1